MLSRLGKKGATAKPSGPDFQAIYDKLRASEMNQWVGGDDPELVGGACANIFFRHAPLAPDAEVLDFGCGVGRVMLALLRANAGTRITGFDIVPKLIGFCEETIGSQFPSTRFELLEGSNDHYEKYKDGTKPKGRDEIVAQYGRTFDAAYAFSVFTHIDADDFVPLLEFVASTLKPGGYFLFTCFLLTPFSRDTVKLGWTLPDLGKGRFEQDGDVFIADPDDRLSFIAYDLGRMEKMLRQSHLITAAIEYGNWRGGGFSHSYQDVILCRKPMDLSG